VVAAAAWLALCGGPWTVTAERLDHLPWSAGLSAPGLALIVLLAAFALTGMVRAARLGAPLGGRLYAACWLSSCIFALGLPMAYRALENLEMPPMEVRVVTREVALEPDSWKILQQHPKSTPRVGILTPTIDYRIDGGDLPAIVMPPPCRVEFQVTEEDGAVYLDFAAGIDLSVNRAQHENYPLQVGFEVKVNGERIFESIQTASKNKPANESRWSRPPENSKGLKLYPGDVVTLRTAIVGEGPSATQAKPPRDVGFGQVILERRETRQRLPSSPDNPNIVLIVQDTMRADHSSLHDYSKTTTPALDALAARGISFSEARSTSSWTWPSTASILTGLLPDEHGVTDDSACYLLSENETLAEALQSRGYTTAAFACNPLISRQKNFSQGFESFTTFGLQFIKTREVIEDVRTWIGMHAGTRFFLYLHLVDPHAPYFPRDDALDAVGEPVPEDFPGQEVLRRYKSAAHQGLAFDEEGRQKVHDPFPAGHLQQIEGLYDASIRTGDHYLDVIVNTLERHGLTNETVIVFTSDHGEEWMDHGRLTHGQSVHRELVHVPLVLAGPGLPGGVQSSTPVSNRHIAATLARIGGADLSRAVDSLDLFTPSMIPERPVFFSTTHGHWNGHLRRQPIYGVRDGAWVLHYAPHGTDFGAAPEERSSEGQVKLYNIESDPNETKDIAAAHPKLASRLRLAILDSLAKQLIRQEGSVQLGGGAATMEMLDGIGYLDDK
jgi:arylsulfatase A-like enzyme